MNLGSNLNRDEIVSKVDENYTLQEILDFLKEYQQGKEEEWFDNFTCKFEHMFGENKEIMNEFHMFRHVSTSMPDTLNISIHTMIFFSQFLCDIGVSSIKESNSFEGDTKILYNRIFQTVMMCMMELTCAKLFNMSFEEWFKLKPTKGQCDIGAWNEFANYVKNETDILPGCKYF